MFRSLTLRNAAALGVRPSPAASITDRLQTLVRQGTYAGIVATYTCSGKTWGPEAVGIRNVETRKLLRPDSIFQVMSMTKPVTAVLS